MRATFQRWCRKHRLEEAAKVFDRDWEQMITFYRFPREHWQHLPTTNPLESPFAALRLRTHAAKRFKRVESATALIWKMLMVAEKRFRWLNAPELLADVYEWVRYVDGKRVPSQEREVAA